jgi:tRNA-Thr(GGU) m(6)t(6)A37 methyltransferase TsaA
MLPSVTFTPIGVIRSPFPDRVSAPRQPYAAAEVEGRIELVAGRGLEHAVEDLEGWDRLWVVFWFHLNDGWRPKVLPPRSAGKRRGVLATRSPHRPNPIGLSVVKLEAVEGLVLRIRGVDMVDGTPVLDLKPSVPYADAFPQARTGWLEPLAPGAGRGGGGEGASSPGAAVGDASPRDPEPGFEVAWSARAAEQVDWLLDAAGIALREPVERALALGPQPHPYRRIRPDGDAMRLAVKDWRVRFRAEGRRIEVLSIATGYRERELWTGEEPEILPHRAFVARFGRA